MCKYDMTVNQDFMKSETEYLAYMQAFLHFLSCYLLELTKDSITEKEKWKAEKQLLSSLLILEKLHHHVIARKKLLEPFFKLKEETSSIDMIAEKLGHQLLNTKKIFSNHPFQSDQLKQQCVTILSHLVSYYPIIPVVNQSPPGLPWVSQDL
ncbi:hypothetical protein MUB24_13695 [Lederbergia sp. NSJ-179]|uniref:hypothetical protein n=1 Tax=Lederbergia sp. NSJ-179 TaxID=2931402 RepID=UPI001FD4EDFF|nr:hypothetical protein [Lederbergia sp. NSJ-179]MCJ7841933.1 hypothetical protein [Lederbergia sp. NSJ-179]